ncbi:MAG TPA: toll/interleukin-1 receptor domain-containing protein, partial [Anaerolineales bacterium]|nr:toll/interleukin-1 receptor domain-containing protein [Anaerolineales bacterium]
MPRPLRVFLCHASQDKPAVRKMYAYLKQHGIQPWLDREDLLPGQDWEIEIPKAIFNSDVILVCLSPNSVNKEGYVQKEIVFALDKAM